MLCNVLDRRSRVRLISQVIFMSIDMIDLYVYFHRAEDLFIFVSLRLKILYVVDCAEDLL
jgi:hypothetical protein